MAQRAWQVYERFLVSNASQITALESSLRSITYILPGRFKDAEIAGEAIYAGVHLLGMYHDSVLFKIVYSRRNKGTDSLVKQARDELAGDLPKMSLHARYTNYWRSSSRMYRSAALMLMMIEATQLLIEMIARRKAKNHAWDVIVGIETLKALLRLGLVRASQDRPVIEPCLPQREIDPSLLERSANKELDTWLGERTGITHRSIHTLMAPKNQPGAEEPDLYDYLLSHTLTDQDVARPARLVRTLQGTIGSAAESLWILRPLLYVLALRKWGKRDFKPYVLSISMELFARFLRRRSFYLPYDDANKLPVPPMSSVSLMLSMLGIENSFFDWVAGSLSNTDPRCQLTKPISSVERDEWTARNRSLWWYLVRGPAWYNYTRPKIQGLVRRTENKRIIGIFGSIAGEYLPLVDEYYYYTAT
ncbi:hypothetical protein MYAM1_001752 [Malassezia yamatoensis]|uniref:Peroxisomal membrane protein PEX16 n=1 Tax=Malassezia yamatoensis TaxID=253288 RepID=A0AAJ5YSL8_9BASI|nr:hypothetical protein MYAM1_001752 [Malassezia yamatoensis]